jgi:hypothetical protein
MTECVRCGHSYVKPHQGVVGRQYCEECRNYFNEIVTRSNTAEADRSYRFVDEAGYGFDDDFPECHPGYPGDFGDS